jgi:hypothetical protein
MDGSLLDSQTQLELMYKISDFIDSLSEEDRNEIFNSAIEILDGFNTDEEEVIVEECRKLKEYKKNRDISIEFIKSSEQQLRDHMGYSVDINGLSLDETIIL